MSLFDGGKPSGGAFGAKPAGGAFSMADDDDAELDGLPPEERAERVLSDAEAAFKQRAQDEARRYELATDSEYWVAMGFQSRRQKEQFLAALRERFGLQDDGDKYLDGWQIAKALGITLDREQVPYNTSEKKIDAKWAGLSRPLPPLPDSR